MKLYIIIIIGTMSIFFQLTRFKTSTDLICLLGSIFLLFLIIYINKKKLINLYNKFYNKFYILTFLILVNNVIIYTSLPQILLVVFKIIITILLIFDIIYLINQKYNIFSK